MPVNRKKLKQEQYIGHNSYPDSSKMFGGLSYVSDLSGLSTLKTDYVTNMEAILCVGIRNKKLKNLDFLASWNTENVENLGLAFCGYDALDNINGIIHILLEQYFYIYLVLIQM